MITLERALRHLRWADDAFFLALAARPPQALDARVAPQGWSVGRLAMHIVQGAQWYRYCLAGVPWTDLDVPVGHGELEMLRRELSGVDAALLDEARLPDACVTFRDDEGMATAWRSTILTQACMHATEHRAQISFALEVSGFDPVVLDDLDLWAFERCEGHSSQPQSEGERDA